MKNNMHVFIISRSFLLRMRNVSHKIVEKIKTHILSSMSFFFENCAFYEIKWKNTVEPYRPQITMWRMRIASWLTNSTDTHSEYVIIIAFLL